MLNFFTLVHPTYPVGETNHDRRGGEGDEVKGLPESSSGVIEIVLLHVKLGC